MEPVSILTVLIYVPAFLVMLILYGNPFRVLFQRHLYGKNIVLDPVERVSLALASGAAILPLIVMALSLFGHVLNTLTSQALTVIFVVVNLHLCKERLKRLRSKLVTLDKKVAIIILVFVAIFVFHLYPSLGLFVYPGDDAKGYSLITLRIIEEGGYTTSWGIFATPLAWYEEKVHLIVSGFAGTCAYFNLLTGLSVEKTVLLVTLVYVSLISLGVYFLAKRLFRSTGIALCSAFVFGMLIREPSFAWFSWGGNAELSSLFLLPVIIGLFWELFHINFDFKYLLYLAFLVSGAAMLHPFSAFYLAFCLIPFSIVLIFMHRKLMPVVKSLAVFFLSIIFILPVFITAVTSEMAIMQLYESNPNPFWTPIFSWSQTPEQALYSVGWRFYAVYGVCTPFLLIASVDTLRRHKIDKEPLILLVAWGLTLFLVHENNPNGLFLIRFPLWYRVDTNRVFDITSFSFSIVTGIGLFKMLNGLAKVSLIRTRNFVSTLKLAYKKVYNKKAILFVLTLCLLQVSFNVIQNAFSRGNSSVTNADISAFNWISQNVPQNATFFVLPNDAGQWIPVYTHRRIVLPFGVVTNITLLYQYYDEIYPKFCEDPYSMGVLTFLNYHVVSYVYVGSKTVLPELYSEKFDPKVLSHSPIFKSVYNKSNVYIFKYPLVIFDTVWSDDIFFSGWTAGASPGDVDSSAVAGVYKLGSTSGGYAYATHDLQLENNETITYLAVRWRTDENAKYGVAVCIDGNYTKIDMQTSSKWTTSMINLNSLGVGRITSITILVEGSGYGYTDYIEIIKLLPVRWD